LKNKHDSRLAPGSITVRRFYRAEATSLDELKQRILKGIDEMNAQPVRFQWKKFDFQMV